MFSMLPNRMEVFSNFRWWKKCSRVFVALIGPLNVSNMERFAFSRLILYFCYYCNCWFEISIILYWWTCALALRMYVYEPTVDNGLKLVRSESISILFRLNSFTFKIPIFFFQTNISRNFDVHRIFSDFIGDSHFSPTFFVFNACKNHWK